MIRYGKSVVYVYSWIVLGGGGLILLCSRSTCILPCFIAAKICVNVQCHYVRSNVEQYMCSVCSVCVILLTVTRWQLAKNHFFFLTMTILKANYLFIHLCSPYFLLHLHDDNIYFDVWIMNGCFYVKSYFLFF